VKDLVDIIEEFGVIIDDFFDIFYDGCDNGFCSGLGSGSLHCCCVIN